MKTLLVIYLLVDGQMRTVYLPAQDIATCQAQAPAVAQALGAVHVECKAKKGKQ